MIKIPTVSFSSTMPMVFRNFRPFPMRHLLAIGFLSLAPAIALDIPTVAQTPPAQTYQPGFWQPVGRFNPKQPVKVKLVNETGLNLDYDITNLESFNPDVIPSGDTRVLENIGDNAYIMVYPVDSSSNPEPGYVLRFSVKTDARTRMVPSDNIATITITKAPPDVEQRFYGHRTINFQKTGAIYFY